MKTERVLPLNVPFDQVPEFAKSGRSIKKKIAGVMYAKPNKQNIDPNRLIDAGMTHVDINPGQSPSGLTYERSATCADVGTIANSFPGGKNLYNIDWNDAHTVAKNLVQNICSGGVAYLTSQMEEASPEARAAGLCLGNDLRGSTSVEYWIAYEQYLKDGIYAGQYDGFGRADILDRVTLADLQSPQTILAFLRFQPGANGGVPTSGSGNKAFLPHTLLNGKEVRGAAEYRDILFSCYAQGWFEPDREVANAAFHAMLGRAGLEALAAEVSDQATKAAILSRRIVGFTWTESAQIGNKENVLQRMRPPGLNGYVQLAGFMPNPVGDQRAVSETVLIETQTGYDWEDTTIYGDDPGVQLGYDSNGFRAGNMGAIVSKTGNMNGAANGLIGTDNVQLGVNVYRFTPNLNGVKLGYPDRALGNQDIPYSALDAYGCLRGFVGESIAWNYLSVFGPNETQYCDTEERTYVFKRYKAKKGWGYYWHNKAKKRISVLYHAFHLEPGQWELPSVKIDGMEILLPECYGGEANEFIMEY